MKITRHMLVGVLGAVIAGAICACSRHERAPSQSTFPPAPARQPFTGLGEPEHPVIVRLAGRTQVLTISGGPRGQVYSVSDHRGRTMLAHATLDELRAQHPELYQQIKTMVATD